MKWKAKLVTAGVIAYGVRLLWEVEKERAEVLEEFNGKHPLERQAIGTFLPQLAARAERHQEICDAVDKALSPLKDRIEV